MVRIFLAHTVHRRVFLPLLLLVVCSASSVGAEPPASKGSFGLFGGLNVAGIRGDFDDLGRMMALELESAVGGDWSSGTASRSDFGLGAYYLLNLSPTFGLQMEAQYIRRGGTLDLRGTNLADAGAMDVETGFKLSYFEIPLLARYRGSPDAKLRPVLLGGPVIGFKTAASLEMSTRDQDQSQDISSGINATTFGLLLGAGLAVEVGGTTSVLIQGRYYLGLTEPIDDSDFSTRSGDFGLFAGLEFALGPGKGSAGDPAPVTSGSGSLPR